MVMLAVGLGGGVMVIWLVLAPNIPTGVAADELRAPFPAPLLKTTQPVRRSASAALQKLHATSTEAL